MRSAAAWCSGGCARARGSRTAPGRARQANSLVWAQSCGSFLFLDLCELFETGGMAASLEFGLEPELEDLVGDARRGDDAPTHGQDVGVVVDPRQPGREQVVAQRGACPAHLVGGQLLALSAAAEHDTLVGLASHDGPR